MNADASLAAAVRTLTARHPHRPVVYRIDLIASAALAWSSLALAGFSSRLELVVPCLLISTFAFYRSAYFVHELVHLPRGAVPGFGLLWHLLIGVPGLLPRLLVDAHAAHHAAGTYGTSHDPEYAPVPEWGRLRLLAETLSLFVVPPLLALRFGVLGPLSFAFPALRRVVWARLSTLATMPGYRRPPVTGVAARWVVVQELACALVVWAVATLAWHGVLPVRVLLCWWVVVGTAFAINQLRTFVAHVYESDGRPMSWAGQARDTVTLEGNWVTELIAPLGTRFHSLHHLAPGIPYHALGRAHAELQRAAPAVLSPGRRRDLRHALALLVSRACALDRRSGKEEARRAAEQHQ